MFNLQWWEDFGEHVCCWAVNEVQGPVLHHPMNKMVMHVNMLGVHMVLVIASQCNCYILIGLHIPQIHRTALFPFPSPPLPKAHVWYNLMTRDVYDNILQISSCTISISEPRILLSIRGVTIPIYFVNSTTDSIRWRIVLFKSVTVLTSDPKSEFLCQSSLYCAEPADPPESPCTPGISPMPLSPCITHTPTNPVLSLSTSSRSCAYSMPSVLVTAT